MNGAVAEAAGVGAVEDDGAVSVAVATAVVCPDLGVLEL